MVKSTSTENVFYSSRLFFGDLPARAHRRGKTRRMRGRNKWQKFGIPVYVPFMGDMLITAGDAEFWYESEEEAVANRPAYAR